MIANNTMYISGVIGFNPSSMEIVPGGAAAETDQILKNMGELLKEAGCTFNNGKLSNIMTRDGTKYV